MSRKIKIDCDGLGNINKEFESQGDTIKIIEKELKNQFEAIRECWQGVDAENFIKNSVKMNRALSKEVRHLARWSGYLKNTTMRYDRNVQEGLTNMKDKTKK